ncbi:helix-turn-helix transcriptional regulator, partial [Actinoplanes sp. NPDC024001]|uniref:helix-turn-helix transcriptional regulator n=1 Tax=Actinoplanes sp. NPDC024001 TaxID=3154598 RepID=UPI0033E759BB
MATAASTLPLTAAKTARPRALRAGVDRPRLFAQLDAAVQEPFTLVCAGPGWGKTMLVSAWAQTRGAEVAWLSLDRHDNEPGLFWAYVIAALRAAGALTEGNPLAAMGSVPTDERERAHRLAAGFALLPQPTVLVIDDFHEIDDQRILTELNDVLRHPPEPLRIILISRAEPALALHRLRTAGRLAEIRTGHLAFTGEEATALIDRHGLTLPPADVGVLLERTEGWAVGLHVGAGFLADPGGGRSIADFAGDVRGIDEYLTEEVLAARSRRQRRFLLQTSICDQICADLANAITEQDDGQRILEQLEHDNDFVVRLGARPLWFRYHHLLREALGHRLQREAPRAVTELHRRAARWYANNNSVIEALEHAVAARDWAYLGRVVTAHASPLIVSAHRPALVRILRQIPADRLAGTAELVICSALLLFHAGDFTALPARLDQARELLRHRPADASSRQAEITMYALQWTADRACGDMPAVADNTNRLLDLIATAPADGAAQAQQRAIALNNRGVARMWTGDADAASRDLAAAVGAARAAGVELAELNATGHLALLQAMCGSVHEAARLTAVADELAERRGWSYTLQAVAGHVAAALVGLERHDLGAAEEAIRRAIRAHQVDSEAAPLLAIAGAQARLAIARGEPARARLFLDEAARHRNPRLRAPALDDWLAVVAAEADLAAGHADRVAQHLAGPAATAMFTLAARIVQARAATTPRRAIKVTIDVAEADVPRFAEA